MKKYFITFIIFITFISLISPVKEALAQASKRSFTVSPPSLKFTLKPGAKTERTLKITNNSAEAVEFFANVEDFIVTNKEGTPELLPVGTKPDNKYAASFWTAVIPDTFIVPAGQSSTTKLYIQIPGDARPGGRYVSVTFRPSIPGAPQGTGAAVNAVVGSLVYLTVEGPIKEGSRVVAFETPKFLEYGPVPFKTEIRNNGDVHITPKASVVVKNIFGRKVYSFALDNLNVFPGVSRVYQNTWKTKWLFGPYTASLNGYYGQQENLALIALTSFWVIPYKLILSLLLAVAIGILGFFYFQKKAEPQEVVETKKKK